MPYITQNRRDLLDVQLPFLLRGPGEFNYVITQLCRQYFAYSGKNYLAINDVIGALESAKLEFYRRVAVPYEDAKILENGDVY